MILVLRSDPTGKINRLTNQAVADVKVRQVELVAIVADENHLAQAVDKNRRESDSRAEDTTYHAIELTESFKPVTELQVLSDE